MNKKVEPHIEMLKMIYTHYCKQHVSKGKIANSFERYHDQMGNLKFGDWIVFCRDFGLLSKTLTVAVVV